MFPTIPADHGFLGSGHEGFAKGCCLADRCERCLNCFILPRGLTSAIARAGSDCGAREVIVCGGPCLFTVFTGLSHHLKYPLQAVQTLLILRKVYVDGAVVQRHPVLRPQAGIWVLLGQLPWG